MIYVVGTVARMGSTMMMRAIAGSSDLEPLKGAGAIIRAEGHDPDYDPNPHGYFEPDLSRLHYDDEGTTWAHNYDGRLLKLRPHGLLRLRPAHWKVVIVRRDPDEVRASYRRAFGGNVSEGDLLDLRICEHVLKARSDVDLVTLDYVAVVADPLPAFVQLKTHGWPIDPVKASAFIDSTLYRNRREGA